jgi:hypothetical protein
VGRFLTKAWRCIVKKWWLVILVVAATAMGAPLNLMAAKAGGKAPIASKPDAASKDKPDATSKDKPDATSKDKPDATSKDKPDATYQKYLATCKAVSMWKSADTCPFYCLNARDAGLVSTTFLSHAGLGTGIDRFLSDGENRECLNTKLGFHVCPKTSTFSCGYRDRRRL